MKNQLFSELNDILAMLDASEYEETYEYISNLVGSQKKKLDPFILACDIMNCDAPKDFPAFVIDFVTELYLLAIEDGNADAMNDLGAHYYEGNRGFMQSFERAFYYYHLAADNGCEITQENLGYCYYYGRSVPVDYEKAFHYFALGAFKGRPISLYKIGDMYAAGYYVTKNEKEAFSIYLKTLDLMDEESEKKVAGPVYLRLGKMFLNGIGVKADPKSALVCYQKAESFLYDMVKDGDVMYKKSLKGAIEGQQKARNVLDDELTSKQWLDGVKD